MERERKRKRTVDTVVYYLSVCVCVGAKKRKRENDPPMMRSVLLCSSSDGGQTGPFFTPTKNKCETRTFRNAFDYNSNSNEIPDHQQQQQQQQQQTELDLFGDFSAICFSHGSECCCCCCELLRRDGGTISWNTFKGNTHTHSQGSTRIIKHTGRALCTVCGEGSKIIKAQLYDEFPPSFPTFLSARRFFFSFVSFSLLARADRFLLEQSSPLIFITWVNVVVFLLLLLGRHGQFVFPSLSLPFPLLLVMESLPKCLILASLSAIAIGNSWNYLVYSFCLLGKKLQLHLPFLFFSPSNDSSHRYWQLIALRCRVLSFWDCGFMDPLKRDEQIIRKKKKGKKEKKRATCSCRSFLFLLLLLFLFFLFTRANKNK